MIFHPISAFFVLPIMLLLLEPGRRFRIRHKAPVESTAIENAVFALFGLLLAFTFSGAVARYDPHRQLLVEETNAIDVAYLRLDLLPPAAQPATPPTLPRLHHLAPWPLPCRLQRGLPALRASTARDLAAVGRGPPPAPGANVDATRLLLPALNTMIDITAHPAEHLQFAPACQSSSCCSSLFSFGAAFLGGYSMVRHGRSWFHMFALALSGHVDHLCHA